MVTAQQPRNHAAAITLEDDLDLERDPKTGIISVSKLLRAYGLDPHECALFTFKPLTQTLRRRIFRFTR